MAKLLQLEKVIDVHCLRLAYAVHIVPRKVDQHNMFGPVLFRREQFRTQPLVLCKNLNMTIKK